MIRAWLQRLLAYVPRTHGITRHVQVREVNSFEASVIVGEESARKLTEILGREVRPGDTIPLGVIAHDDPTQVGTHVFSDPRLHS